MAISITSSTSSPCLDQAKLGNGGKVEKAVEAEYGRVARIIIGARLALGSGWGMDVRFIVSATRRRSAKDKPCHPSRGLCAGVRHGERSKSVRVLI